MNFKKITIKTSLFLCCVIAVHADSKQIKKRGIMDNFANVPRTTFSYNGNSNPNLIGTFLPQNHQVQMQHSQNADFIIHYPTTPHYIREYLQETTDPNCYNFFQNNPQFPPISFPSSFPNRPFQIGGITNIPHIPVQPIGFPDIPAPSSVETTNSINIPDISKVSSSIDLNPTIVSSTHVYPPNNPTHVDPINSFNDFPKQIDLPNLTSTGNAPLQPIIFPNDKDETAVINDLDIRNESNKRGSTKSTESSHTTSHININHVGISSEVRPAAEISELTPYDPLDHVIPLIPVYSEDKVPATINHVIPVNSESSVSESSSTFTETHQYENKEGWIEIPKYHYKPVPANTVNDINNDISKTTFSLNENKILDIPPERERPIFDAWSENVHFSDNDLPRPSFDDLEDLLNRTYENTTTTVYTRMDPLKNAEYQFKPNSLAYQPEGEGREINFLSKPDPKNPPAPLNQQPNTLLIDDWLETSRRIFDTLEPGDQKKVYDANKAVVSGKYKLDKNDQADGSDVELKLLKDNYLVAERTKDNDINFSTRIDNDNTKLSDKKKLEFHPKKTESPAEKKLTNKVSNNTNAIKLVSKDTILKEDEKQPTNKLEISTEPKATNTKHPTNLDDTDNVIHSSLTFPNIPGQNLGTGDNSTDPNRPPLSYLLTIFDENFNDTTEHFTDTSKDELETYNTDISIPASHDVNYNQKDTTTDPDKPSLPYLLTIFDENFEKNPESSSDTAHDLNISEEKIKVQNNNILPSSSYQDHIKESKVPTPPAVSDNVDNVKKNHYQPTGHPTVPSFNINNLPHINNNIRPALTSLMNGLWSNTAQQNHNIPSRLPQTLNVPERPSSSNTVSRPPARVNVVPSRPLTSNIVPTPAHTPTAAPTRTGLVSDMVNRVIEGVVQSTVREMVKNFGDRPVPDLFRRLFG